MKWTFKKSLKLIITIIKELKQKRQTLGHIIKYFLKKYFTEKINKTDQKQKRKRPYSNIKKPDLKKKEVCLFFFKLQNCIQTNQKTEVKKNHFTFIIINIRKKEKQFKN